MKIFVSHASEDHGAAEELAARLRTEDHDVFLDRDDLPHGDEYDARIRAAIAGCDLFLFLLTPRSVAPGRYTLSELGFARERFPNPRGRVLPVALAPTPLADVDPYLKAVTLLQPKGNWIAETLAAVNAIALARRRRRWYVGAGAALLVAMSVGALKLAGFPVAKEKPTCRFAMQGPPALAGLGLDVTTTGGTQAFRLGTEPVVVDLGTMPGAKEPWRILLRGRDGGAQGETQLAGCPETRQEVDLGGDHVLVLVPR